MLDKGGEYERYVISCRGSEFLCYWTKGMRYNYSFVHLLEARDIQFIEPKTD